MSVIVAQKINKEYARNIDLAIRYYRVVAAINDISLSKREEQLLAHTAVRGVISSITSKEEFIKKFGSTKATTYNMISKLCKLKFLIKEDGRITVNKQICPDFSKSNIVLQLNLTSRNDQSL